MTDLTDSYRLWTKVTPRYSDQDPMAHINNVAIGAYLEVGRLHLLEEVLKACAGTKTAMVLARVTVDYKSEMKYPDIIDVGCRIDKIGGKSLTSSYVLFQGDTCCVVSEAVNVFFDIETRKATSPSDEIRGMLQSMMANGT